MSENKVLYRNSSAASSTLTLPAGVIDASALDCHVVTGSRVAAPDTREHPSHADETRAFAILQRKWLEDEGYTPEQVERGMEPLLAYLFQVEWEEAHEGKHYHDK